MHFPPRLARSHRLGSALNLLSSRQQLRLGSMARLLLPRPTVRYLLADWAQEMACYFQTATTLPDEPAHLCRASSKASTVADGACVTITCWVATFVSIELTPSTLASAFLTAPAQPSQVIPTRNSLVTSVRGACGQSRAEQQGQKA